LAVVGGEVERFVGEGEVADDRVVEPFGAGAVELDVVGGPADAELVAAGGELADEVGESAIVGVAAGFGAKDGDGVVGDGVRLEHGGFFASEALDAAVGAVDGKPGLGGRDLGPSRGGELANVLRRVHAVDPTTAPAGLGVPASSPHDRDSLMPRCWAWVDHTEPGGTSRRGAVI
jgi:hypothetical protein